jgi:hypothetical protein
VIDAPFFRDTVLIHAGRGRSALAVIFELVLGLHVARPARTSRSECAPRLVALPPERRCTRAHACFARWRMIVVVRPVLG